MGKKCICDGIVKRGYQAYDPCKCDCRGCKNSNKCKKDADSDGFRCAKCK